MDPQHRSRGPRGLGKHAEPGSYYFNNWNWQKLIGIVGTLRKAYLSALEGFAGVTERLENLKSSLGSEAVAELETQYQPGGGEQFLEDRDGLKWLSRQELLAKMGTFEGSAARGAPGAEQHSVSHVDFLCKALCLEEMQAKLRQRDHNVSELGSNASPQMKTQMAALCEKLASGFRQHYETLAEVAPQLMNSGHQVLPDAPHVDEILLPSRSNPDQIDSMALRELLELEVQLPSYMHTTQSPP